jgi:hypothetical protein
VLTVADPLEQVARHGQVESRVAELMGTINTATAALVEVISDVVDDDVWQTAGGIKSPEHWVTWQCGVSHARAVALLQMARRRHELPASSALFDEGRITEDVMAAIARRAPSERDAEVAAQVHQLLYSQVDRLLRTMPKPEAPPAEPIPDRVTFGSDGERWKMHVNLPLDVGVLVEKALTVGRSQVFFERHPDAETENRSEVSWADGLVRAAELALRQAAVVNGREHRPADRYQVFLHFEVAEMRANLHLGPVVPDAVRRYLACDADVRALIESNDALVEFSSKLRIVDDKLRAFIEQRDGGCRVPGCPQNRWLQIHHIWHWEDGGPTTPSNLCALCPMHHRIHHLGLLEIRGSPNQPDGLRFFDNKGREITAIPRSPRTGPVSSHAQSYVHPSGEHVDWQWFDWNDLDDAALN